VQDNTHLLQRGPLTAVIGCSSMADGNMISDETGSYTAPGTASETTSAASAPAYTPTIGQSDKVPIGTAPERHASDDGYRPAPVAWKTLPDNGYSEGSTPNANGT